MSFPYCGHSCNTNNSYYPHKTMKKSWYCVLLLHHWDLIYFNLLETKTVEVFNYLFRFHNNPICTLSSRFITLSHPMLITYLISEKHDHKLLYPHSLFPVNYDIIGKCFIFKLEGLRWMVSFFPTSSPFPLVIFFVLLLWKPAAMVPV